MYNIVFKSKKNLNLNLLTVETDTSYLISSSIKILSKTHWFMVL